MSWVFWRGPRGLGAMVSVANLAPKPLGPLGSHRILFHHLYARQHQAFSFDPFLLFLLAQEINLGSLRKGSWWHARAQPTFGWPLVNPEPSSSRACLVI